MSNTIQWAIQREIQWTIQPAIQWTIQWKNNEQFTYKNHCVTLLWTFDILRVPSLVSIHYKIRPPPYIVYQEFIEVVKSTVGKLGGVILHVHVTSLWPMTRPELAGTGNRHTSIWPILPLHSMSCRWTRESCAHQHRQSDSHWEEGVWRWIRKPRLQLICGRQNVSGQKFTWR